MESPSGFNLLEVCHAGCGPHAACPLSITLSCPLGSCLMHGQHGNIRCSSSRPSGQGNQGPPVTMSFVQAARQPKTHALTAPPGAGDRWGRPELACCVRHPPSCRQGHVPQSSPGGLSFPPECEGSQPSATAGQKVPSPTPWLRLDRDRGREREREVVF